MRVNGVDLDESGEEVHKDEIKKPIISNVDTDEKTEDTDNYDDSDDSDDYDDSDDSDDIHKNERIHKILNVVCVVLAVCAVITLVVSLYNLVGFVRYSWNLSSLTKTIESDYEVYYNKDNIYVKTQIVTAKISYYEDGIAYTDIGEIPLETEPKGSVITLFIDINGEYRPAEEINSSGNIEYIINDIDVGENETILQYEYDRSQYKAYANKLTELEIIEEDRDYYSSNTRVAALAMLGLLVVAAICYGVSSMFYDKSIKGMLEARNSGNKDE
jgi:hypothetical protein